MKEAKVRATLSMLKVLLEQAKTSEDHKVTVDENFLRTVNDVIVNLAENKVADK